APNEVSPRRFEDMELGRIGIWTSALDRQPSPAFREAIAEIENLDFGALWVGEAARREAFANASLLRRHRPACGGDRHRQHLGP
ncbi:MAG: hypothetical protein ACRDV4_12090, partial [Acidimicrobiales bacterium]